MDIRNGTPIFIQGTGIGGWVIGRDTRRGEYIIETDRGAIVRYAAELVGRMFPRRR